MRELLRYCPKMQFFHLIWCFLRLEGGEFGKKRCEGKCSNGERAFVPQKNLALPPALNYLSERYKNRAIITRSFVLTTLNLRFLKTFEN